MSSAFLFNDEIPVRRTSPSAGGPPAGKGAFPAANKVFVRRILIAAAVLIGAELVWFFGISPCMPLSRVEVKGIPGLDAASVIALAGIGENSSFMTVDSGSIESSLLQIPAVHSVRAVKHFPGRLEIILEPRRPAAMALVERGGRFQPVLIDGRGLIYSVGKEGFDGNEIIPIVSGLSLDGSGPGVKLPRMYGPLFEQLENLAAEVPELIAAVSEIRINQKNYDGFDLTLYPAHTSIRVRVGPDLNEDTLRYMLLILDVLAPREDDIEELDFRAGTASYTLKEAYSG
ncbi:MAG: FtsQ-type POTRA domain-containing protein [Treponema sp.]|jgi:cell division protein FtsQ|nr:FtsQ-type POTRA domain-containing protein [Treponema sp.]